MSNSASGIFKNKLINITPDLHNYTDNFTINGKKIVIMNTFCTVMNQIVTVKKKCKQIFISDKLNLGLIKIKS